MKRKMIKNKFNKNVFYFFIVAFFTYASSISFINMGSDFTNSLAIFFMIVFPSTILFLFKIFFKDLDLKIINKLKNKNIIHLSFIPFAIGGLISIILLIFSTVLYNLASGIGDLNTSYYYYDLIENVNLHVYSVTLICAFIASFILLFIFLGKERLSHEQIMKKSIYAIFLFTIYSVVTIGGIWLFSWIIAIIFNMIAGAPW